MLIYDVLPFTLAAVQGCPYHDKFPLCYSSLITLDPTPHLPLVATCSIAWSVCSPVTYINPNTSPKELQLSSLGYFPSLQDELLVIPTHPVVVTILLFPCLHHLVNPPPQPPCNPTTLSPCHHVTLSPCHHIASSPCHLITLSPCHLATSSLRHDTLSTKAPYCLITLSSLPLSLPSPLSSPSPSCPLLVLVLASSSSSSSPCPCPHLILILVQSPSRLLSPNTPEHSLP